MRPLEVFVTVTKTECRVCGIPHDRELHASVMGVRRWLRLQLLLAGTPLSSHTVNPGLKGMACLGILQAPRYHQFR